MTTFAGALGGFFVWIFGGFFVWVFGDFFGLFFFGGREFMCVFLFFIYMYIFLFILPIEGGCSESQSKMKTSNDGA